MDPQSFSHLIKGRYSVRDFLPDDIPAPVLEQILDDARYVASWSNTRPYMLAVASGDQADRLRSSYTAAFDKAVPLLRKDPVALAKAGLSGGLPDADFKTWRPYPPDLRERQVKVGKALYGVLGIERSDRAAREAEQRRNCEFFGAPTVVLACVHSGLMPFAAQDVGLMLQTLMLSAWANGVGSCALGTLATWRHPLDQEFDIPKDYKLITGLALGYPSGAAVNSFRAEHPPLTLAQSRTR